MYRSVVLGAPGAGKTTLTQKLIHDLCLTEESKGLCIPFLITLRKYDQRNEVQPQSFSQYIAENITAELQIPVPRLAIEYLLFTGRSMVILDGLDELLKLDRRKILIESIHSFSRRYYNSSVLVTSRVVGYEEAPLNRKVFARMHLANFDEDAVWTYVTNWFGLNPRLSPTEKSAVGAQFMRESSSVRDLRSNPLLLSLMCNIFRGGGYIPQNRSDLYERCATMLFDEWDQSRGIDSGGPLKADAKFALQDIAYWVLTNQGLSAGIPEPMLRKRLSKFLADARYGSEAAARRSGPAQTVARASLDID
jgi:predicted NACHT family NTPase